MESRTKATPKPESFDVTVQSVIGTVSLDERGEKTAIHAAFYLIADYVTDNSKGTHLASGTFSFSEPYGGIITTVEVTNG